MAFGHILHSYGKYNWKLYWDIAFYLEDLRNKISKFDDRIGENVEMGTLIHWS